MEVTCASCGMEFPEPIFVCDQPRSVRCPYCEVDQIAPPWKIETRVANPFGIDLEEEIRPDAKRAS